MRSRMTVIPKMMSQWWETLDRPHRLFDQHFGLGTSPKNFLRSSFFDRYLPSAYFQSWEEFMKESMREEERGTSIVNTDKDQFQVALDVQQFKPDEINVKVVDNSIVVEGKHEEKRDDHGYIARHFVRKYLIPEECDPEKTTSTLSTDGVLMISTPLKPEAITAKEEKPIKIEHFGKPAIEKKEEPEEKQRLTSSQST
ncbi:protein lethal(2)essential for life-like [Belonocnema kinseyi]|uniref:protein lethal(2)essential for life-like n=1 Tax=Belonocnema kinseyi TaxID=2817044 RepID=UPI00143D5450|nr:protein lethal(2)essential for life-like [Belonocnema kinseyi]